MQLVMYDAPYTALDIFKSEQQYQYLEITIV